VSHAYQVRLYDRATGALTAIFDDWNSLYYYRRLNDYGYHTFSIDGDDPKRELFQLDTLVQVLRRDEAAGIPWTEDYIAFHRTGVQQVTDRGRVLFSSYGRSLEELLKRRHILWRPGDIAIARGQEGEYLAGAADDVMKQYVRENIGNSAALSNGRMAEGKLDAFTVDASFTLAPSWEGRRAYKNLLAVVQEVGAARSVDFDVTWSAPSGALLFQFHTYYPRKGQDRTGAGTAAPVVFSLEHANMSAPYLTESRMNEITAVYVLGQGEGVARTFVERTNVFGLDASPWNRVEYTHDARTEAGLGGLQALGDAHLLEHGPDNHMSFQVIASPGSVYGREYFIGDLILGKFLGAEQPRKIIGVEVTVADGDENIRIHFEGEEQN